MRIYISIPILLLLTYLSSCSKMIRIPEPAGTITASKVFSSDATAASAIAGVYSQLINGTYGASIGHDATNVFSDGLTTILAGLSSDELQTSTANSSLYRVYTNDLTAQVAERAYIPALWSTAYTIGVYGANAILEGVDPAVSPGLSDSARIQLTAEAKFVRAFCHLYLTNFFGDVPLVLTTDFNQTSNLPRTPQNKVYAQIIRDLEDARAALPDGYTISSGQRIRPNKWAATALLARVYLYTGDYTNAANEAGQVIIHSDLYHLEPRLDDVFLTGSYEAIWQLKQNSSIPNLGNATAEGVLWLPNPVHTGTPPFCYLTSQLVNAFEPGDLRRSDWIDSTDYTPGNGIPPSTYYYPAKYKTGSYNYVLGGTATEYYMVLRLAEQYLIRAEAQANGAAGGDVAAIADVNAIRRRAGLPDLPGNLSNTDLKAAISKEWQREFFCEWGHRWFNLKRTKQAHDVLSAIPAKQPWKGDSQLLYPLPTQDISVDHYLIQNAGY